MSEENLVVEESSNAIGNLTDVAGQSEDTTPTINQSEGAIDPNGSGVVDENGWFLSEGVQGEGEKPEWFVDNKYKSVSEQAKGYKELEKKLGAFTGSPDDYSNDLGAEYDGIEFDPDDELLSGFKALAKDSNMSQEGYTDMMKMFVDYTLKQEKTQENDVRENALAELEKIGPNPSTQINEMVQWFAQNFPNMEINDFKNSIRTAADFKVIKTMRSAMGYKKMSASGIEVPRVNHQELMERLNSEKYNNDPLERAEVDRQYAIGIKQGTIS